MAYTVTITLGHFVFCFQNKGQNQKKGLGVGRQGEGREGGVGSNLGVKGVESLQKRGFPRCWEPGEIGKKITMFIA